MSGKSSIFAETYKNYLAQVGRIDLKLTAERLGIALAGEEAEIPFFGQLFRVSSRGVFDLEGREPAFAVRVALCRYLLLAPKNAPAGEAWVSYKDFKDAAPFVGGFVSRTEQALVRYFSGRLDPLKEACRKTGARPVALDLSYQVAVRFEALPHIPILLLFNDEDEEFPAQGTLLFQKTAAGYLDMECLAILGWYLTDALNQAAGSSLSTIM
jgi:Domain of unknown function (DUF3786)